MVETMIISEAELAQSISQSQYQGASAEAIQYHYDVNNDFYQLWLDETRTYSAGLWDEGDTLEQAQIRKIDVHIQQARAAQAERVLDIGCGWGTVLKRLVNEFGVQHATGLTLSQAQADWVRSLNNPHIHVCLESWSDHRPENPYDAIISIGAFEHFAKPNLSASEKVGCYRTFFERCHEWLQPGGWMSLQTITYENYTPKNFNQFFSEEIFPESDLPRLSEIAAAAERRFEIVALHSDRQGYERTLRHWLSRLKENRAAAVDLVGEETVIRYEKYFNICIIGFHIGSMNLMRIALRRIDKPADA